MRLTIEIAKKFVADPYHIGLDNYTSLDDDAAEFLASLERDLHLNGLTTLSDHAVNALVEHGRFSFYTMEGCYELQLRGLESLSDFAAKVFLGYEGVLVLNPAVLNSLQPETAALLEEQFVQFMQIRTALNCLQMDGPVYYGYCTLDSSDAASILARCSGNLTFTNLSLLSVDAAEMITEHQGDWLYIDSLETISLEAASALGKFSGVVSLRGLPPFTADDILDEGVEYNELLETLWALAVRDPRFDCEYELPTLHSVAAAEAFANYYYDDLQFDDENDGLNLNSVTSISAGAAAALATVYHLHLDGLKEIDQAIARGLTKEHVHLSLNGLQELTVEVARELARSTNCLAEQRDVETMAAEYRILSLNGLKTLTPDAAAALVGKDQKDANFVYELLSLDGLTDLSLDAVKNLIRRNSRGESICQVLSLNGIERISDEVALVLGEYSKGLLKLNAVKSLSANAMIALGKLGGNDSFIQLHSLKVGKELEETFVQHLLGSFHLEFE